jgi:ribosomal protein S18 acetylase RimI-like enzyme
MQATKVIIRKAKISDLNEIKRINEFGKELNTYTIMDHLDKKSNANRNGSIDYTKKYINGKNKYSLVAEEDSKIIGFILFEVRKREDYWKIKKAGYIELVYISKISRRRGVGRLLMNEATKILKKRKIQYLQLTIQSKNKLAKRVWQHYGFKTHREDMFRKI